MQDPRIIFDIIGGAVSAVALLIILALAPDRWPTLLLIFWLGWLCALGAFSTSLVCQLGTLWGGWAWLALYAATWILAASATVLLLSSAIAWWMA